MISGDLEYLLTSLPHLSFDGGDATKARVTTLLKSYAGPAGEDLKLDSILNAEAQKFLSAGKYAHFSSINLDHVHEMHHRQNSNQVLSEFALYTYSLKTALRDLRIQRRKTDNYENPAGAKQPIEPGSPLDEEIQILKLFWTRAEELSAGHFSDYEALLIYKLKLLILLRLWSFNAELGYKIYSNLVRNN